jgi:RimK family alpha-L-glutamate ligase
MKNFLLVVIKQSLDSYRVRRLKEEIEKRGHRVHFLCSSEAMIFSDKIYYKDKEIRGNDYDFIYSIGNDEKNKYILYFFKNNSKAKIWPDDLDLDDKFNEGVFLSSLGVATPKTILMNNKNNENIERLSIEIGGFPFVIKKVSGSEGKYVSLVKSKEDVLNFIKKLPHPSITGKKNIIFQEYLKNSKGTDFRVFCVGDKILGAIKRTSQNGDFRANISLGGKAEKFDLNPEMLDYSEKIIKNGKFLLVGIDFIKNNDKYLVIEINNSANFEGFEKSTGIDVAGKIVDEFLKK